MIGNRLKIAGGHSDTTDIDTEMKQLKEASALGFSVRETMFRESVHAVLPNDKLLALVIQRLLTVPASDLFQWAEEPELFVVEQESLNEKEKLNVAAEGLFLSLAEFMPDVSVSKLLLFFMVYKHNGILCSANNE
jgi:hypothetical protein